MALKERLYELSGSVTRRSKGFLVSRKKTNTKVRGPESPLYIAICPVVYVLRIFGLAPYEFHNGILVPSEIHSIFSYVWFIAYSYFIYYTLSRFLGVKHDQPLLGYTESIKAASNFLMAAFDIVMTLFSREKFVWIWNVMQDYDETVRNLGYARKETRTCVWTWFMLITNFLIWMAVHRSGMVAFDEYWINNMSYMIVYVGSSVSIIKFSGMALLLGQRFHHLSVIAKKKGPLASRWLRASPVVDTKDIEYLHNVLMIASERLNDLYSWSLLLWLGNLCLHIVSGLYFIMTRLMSWNIYEWRVISCLIAWLASFLGQLTLLTFTCDFTAFENVETSIHLINRRLNFSASGCCSVDLSLLRSHLYHVPATLLWTLRSRQIDKELSVMASQDTKRSKKLDEMISDPREKSRYRDDYNST